MIVNLELYRIFYKVAKYKHMSKAANELFISQPAVSQAIKKLESQLGGTLFLRSNKGLELTKEGEMLYSYISGVIDLINNAENEFSNFKELKAGEIKIGVSTTLTKLVLSKSLKEFAEYYPNINIIIVNDLTSNLILDLQKGKLDFIIFNEGDSIETSIKIISLRKIHHTFLYNKNKFNFDKPLSFKELNNYPLILQKKESNSRKYLDLLMISNKINLIPKIEVVSQELVNELTEIGLGIGFSIKEMISLDKYQSLKELETIPKIKETTVNLAISKTILPTFASKKFIEYLIKNNS